MASAFPPPPEPSRDQPRPDDGAAEPARLRLPRPGVWVAAAAAALAIWVFIELSEDLFGGGSAASRLLALDRLVLQGVSSLRRGWLTGLAIDLTALGSPALLTLVTAVGLLLVTAVRDRAGAVQLLVTAAGAGLWVAVLKQMLERDRPAVVARLVEVTGYSYPSGHSLAAAAIYPTLAILAFRLLAPGWRRVALLGVAFALVAAVGASRVYLGVHYPSDVLAGLLVGSAWAFLTTAARLVLARSRPT